MAPNLYPAKYAMGPPNPPRIKASTALPQSHLNETVSTDAKSIHKQLSHKGQSQGITDGIIGVKTFSPIRLESKAVPHTPTESTSKISLPKGRIIKKCRVSKTAAALTPNQDLFSAPPQAQRNQPI